jgi:hypothetical protein
MIAEAGNQLLLALFLSTCNRRDMCLSQLAFLEFDFALHSILIVPHMRAYIARTSFPRTLQMFPQVHRENYLHRAFLSTLSLSIGGEEAPRTSIIERLL